MSHTSKSTVKNHKYFSFHNANVMEKVPKDRLLIWNLKDGWEPICKFLNVSIPDQPIPVLNKTTDPLFFDRLRVDLRKRQVKTLASKNVVTNTAIHQYPSPRIIEIFFKSPMERVVPACSSRFDNNDLNLSGDSFGDCLFHISSFVRKFFSIENFDSNFI